MRPLMKKQERMFRVHIITRSRFAMNHMKTEPPTSHFLTSFSA